MIFSSVTFLVFFLPTVLATYYISKNAAWRNGVLIVLSVFFYAWGEPRWVAVLLLTVFVNYVCGIAIGRTERPSARTAWMLLGVVLGVGFLIYFKYFGLLLSVAAGLTGRSVDFRSPVLPIGISFYTFQVLTYTIDVYKRKVEPQRSFFSLLLYVSFFPQLIAGPIVNYKDIRACLGERTVTLDRFYEGALRFFIGLAKKVLIANMCGELAQGLGMTGNLSVAGAWLGAVAYTFQIYYDFSGYSDMAIGMGAMFGFHFLENFRYPYISKSITEFWRRWHISLGAFFREYVYIPLGGNRVDKARQIRNIMVVWALTGLWHGASYNFLLWGLYYGILLVLEKLFFARLQKKLPAPVNIAVTLFLVIVGWVIFYHVDLGDLWNQLGAMFGITSVGWVDPRAVYYGKRYLGFLILAALAGAPWKEEILPRSALYRKRIESRLKSSTAILVLKSLAISVMALVSIGLLVEQSYNPFLYFRF